jgi:hypothetical protein
MQGGFRISFGRRPSYLVLGTQPLAQPSDEYVWFRPVAWLIALQMRCTRFFDGVVPQQRAIAIFTERPVFCHN